VSSRLPLVGFAALAVALPAAAATPPPSHTPQQAVDVVKRIVNRHMKACHLDWARIVAEGFEGNWTINVKVRSSRAGKGTARWTITDGFPVARNKLAKAITHDCP
jgi:hypothetical protein